jgi:IS605 OrfB family transposase
MPLTANQTNRIVCRYAVNIPCARVSEQETARYTCGLLAPYASNGLYPANEITMPEFLTAVFELRPSRRKAAAVERVRATAESMFWDAVGKLRNPADAIVAIEAPKERQTAAKAMRADIARNTMASASKAGLSEAVAQGLTRDITASVMSYVGLRANGHAAEWPSPVAPDAADHAAALNEFLTATTKDAEDAARDALALVSKVPGPRPLTMARARDATLLRRSDNGSIVLVLNVLRASDPRARQVHIDAGIDASTGEVTKAQKSSTRLIVPVSCSKWHEQKFLSGRATLKSSLIVRRRDRWFLCAQFEMAEASRPRLTGARMGVDRGIANPVAMAVADRDGAVIAAPKPAGSEIGDAIHKAERRRRAEQRRRGVSSLKHARQVDHHLHHLANDIVRDAKTYGAQVVVEKLDGFKAAIRTKRVKGARKNPWQKSLKNVQLGKLETILDYKLKLAGLPPAREVFAARTSISCPACGQTDPKSRVAQDKFVCTGCGFEVHADTCGAVNVARRDIAFTKHKKGGDFAALERDMVAGLRSRDDGGLGPLAAGLMAASGFVAVRATADRLYETQLVLNLSAGQNAYPDAIENGRRSVFSESDGAFPGHSKSQGMAATDAIENRRKPVFAERDGAFSGHSKQRRSVESQRLTQERLL